MDFRYACRSLIRSPGLSALIVVTLALGVGATTTMFSAVWAVFFRPLPFPEPHRLVTVWRAEPHAPGARQRVTPADFVDWAARSTSFEAIGALPNWSGEPWIFNVAARRGMERVPGIYASSGFFTTMGVQPLVGRGLSADADRTRGLRSVVVSHRYWQTQFGGDASIVGRTIEIDTFRGGAFTIVGVMPPTFDFPRGTDLWLSLADWGGGAMPPSDAAERCCPWYTVVARLKREVTIEAAQRELAEIARGVAARHPNGSASEVQIDPLRDTLVGDHRVTLFSLLGAVGCILLIGAANVANLLLSRAVSRRREVSTRLALGATRWRLARQLLMESSILAAIGTSCALLLSMWTQALVRTALGSRVPMIDETRYDWLVFAFAIGLTFLVASACGLFPLVDWRTVDWSARGQTESGASRRIRQALVVGQVAIAVAVIVSAGLLVRTVLNLRSVDVGFETARTLILGADLTTSALRNRGSAAQFVEELLPRLAVLPGVRAVGATTGVPLEVGRGEQAITRQDQPVRPAAESPHVAHMAVTPDYFKAMGIALTRGRSLSENDRADGVLVAVVNETAARRHWPGEDPIGKRFAIGSQERFGFFRAPARPGDIEWRAIVGVVADFRSAGFASEIQPEIYYNYKQFPLYDPSIVVRTTGNPADVVPSVRAAIAGVNSRAMITRVRTLEDVADQSIADPRLRAGLASLFSALALMLGMLGIYGLMSYTVARQTRELGIRMALGAHPTRLALVIVGKTLRLTLVGIGVGLVLAYVGARWISTLFFGVAAGDVLTLSSACLLLVAAAIVATAYPARQAMSVDPAVALRTE
jgi:putative ABC transport system permease protein